MTTHELKCWTGPFLAICDGSKTHEIRKQDRPYAVGDRLHLGEYVPETIGIEGEFPGFYTGRSLMVEVTYLTPGGEWGLPADVCVMSIRRV